MFGDGRNELAENTFGERVRAMREEHDLTQADLAALLPDGSRGARTGNWVSQVEAGTVPAKLEWLPDFSRALGVSIEWLVTGEASGDSEFIARLRGLEPQLDRRGRNAVLAIAQQQVDDSE